MKLTDIDPNSRLLRLSAGSPVTDNGVIRDVTIAKADVEAQGKILLLDGQGNRVSDPRMAAEKLPIWTDGKTLDTLMAAAQDAGGKLKARENHDDTLSARIGYVDNFRLKGDRVIGDLHIFDSYLHRALVLETIAKTPDKIGFSIDFDPTFEIENNRALMRVQTLTACDLVDEGAITPNGLFLNSEVEIKRLDRNSNITHMATEKSDKNSPVEDKDNDGYKAALKSISDSHAVLSKQVADCMAAVSEMAKNLVPPAPVKDAMSVTRKDIEELFSKQNSNFTEQLSAIKQTNAALGLKPGAGNIQAAAGSPEPTPGDRADGKKDEGKDYLSLVKAKKSEGKMSASDCHREVMQCNPEAYRAYLNSKGISGVKNQRVA